MQMPDLTSIAPELSGLKGPSGRLPSPPCSSDTHRVPVAALCDSPFPADCFETIWAGIGRGRHGRAASLLGQFAGERQFRLNGVDLRNEFADVPIAVVVQREACGKVRRRDGRHQMTQRNKTSDCHWLCRASSRHVSHDEGFTPVGRKQSHLTVRLLPKTRRGKRTRHFLRNPLLSDSQGDDSARRRAQTLRGAPRQTVSEEVAGEWKSPRTSFPFARITTPFSTSRSSNRESVTRDRARSRHRARECPVSQRSATPNGEVEGLRRGVHAPEIDPPDKPVLNTRQATFPSSSTAQ